MKIQFSREALLKLKYFVKGTKQEISGLGKSEFQFEHKIDSTPNLILISDVEIFKQESSHASTTLNEQAMAKFLNELIVKGENPADWNVWWHSHADMQVFWSTTDEDTINKNSSPFLISVLMNHDLNILTRLDIFKPFRFTIENPLLTFSDFKGRDSKIKKYCENKITKCQKIQKPIFQDWLEDGKWTKKKLKKWERRLKKWEKQHRKGSKGRHKSSTHIQHKMPFRSLVQATSGDKQRGVWRKWDSVQ